MSKSIADEVKALREKEAKAHKQLVRAILSTSDRFQTMVDAFKKINRYVKEADNLVDDDKYEERKANLMQKLDELEARREVAVNAKADLIERRDQHTQAQEVLAKRLIELLESGKQPDTEAVDTILDEIGADELAVEPDDPFTAYRRNTASDDNS